MIFGGRTIYSYYFERRRTMNQIKEYWVFEKEWSLRSEARPQWTRWGGWNKGKTSGTKLPNHKDKGPKDRCAGKDRRQLDHTHFLPIDQGKKIKAHLKPSFWWAEGAKNIARTLNEAHMDFLVLRTVHLYQSELKRREASKCNSFQTYYISSKTRVQTIKEWSKRKVQSSNLLINETEIRVNSIFFSPI